MGVPDSTVYRITGTYDVSRVSTAQTSSPLNEPWTTSPGEKNWADGAWSIRLTGATRTGAKLD